MRFRWREQSSTSPVLIVWPFCDVPPPRGVTATPSSRAIAIAAATSSASRGKATAAGMTW
jgi:hypothetical protein